MPHKRREVSRVEGFSDAEIIVEKDFNLGRIKLTRQTFVVVSTQGEGDEEALEQAVNSGPDDATYIAFVASKTKAGKVMDYLRARGVAAERLQQVRAPAGLDLGAKSPEEIAVSILAEIVQVRSGNASHPQQQPQPSEPKAAPAALPGVIAGAKDPICGMLVDPGQARYKSEYQGKWFYFCCAGCQRQFDQAPAKHAAFAVD